MALLALTTLLYEATKAEIYAKALEVADTLGLPVTSWSPGDPTRSLYHVLSEELETVEEIVSNYVASGFLDWATGDWLTLLANQVFRAERTAATYATTTVTLTNGGGGYFGGIEAGDITFKNSLTGATYTNTSGGDLLSGPGTTLDVTVVADEAGSDGSAGATEIDTLVTTYNGVTCSNATAATGVDEESDAALRIRCRAKLGSLSPNGPADAYDYVATTSELTGTTNVTRSRTDGDSTTGDVDVYLAGPSGAVAGPDVTLVESAILTYATPQCITPNVVSATAVSIAVTYQLWLYEAVGETTATIKVAVAAALAALFAAEPIGGDIITTPPGSFYKELIEATILKVYPNHAFRVSVAAPAGDTSLTISQVATLGTVTPTVTLVSDP